MVFIRSTGFTRGNSMKSYEAAKTNRNSTNNRFCVDCAVTDFFKNRSPLAELLSMNPLGTKMLLDPRVQKQFAGLMQAGNADAKPEEINWQRVVENWDLPFPTKRRKARKKGQADRSHSRQPAGSSQDS